MTLLLSVARRTGEGERELRAGNWAGWRPTHLRGTQVTGKTLGCIGFGRIAQATADRAHFGFGMKIIFSDPYMPSDEVIKKYNATPCKSVEEVLEKADFVSIHCPGGESTYHLMNKERIGLMKKGSGIINTSRGGLVDETALMFALDKEKLAYAGLDVFDNEPTPSIHLLMHNAISMTPHIGAATLEAQDRIGIELADQIISFFKK